MAKMDRRTLRTYIGDDSQVLGVKDYIWNSGRAGGVRAFDLKNGNGLEMTVLADRCLDVPYLSYKGVNLAYVSKTGVTAPQYYVEDGAQGFLKSFYAGFLTTGGLTYMGGACEDNGQKLGLHGPIGNTPAENAAADVQWEGDAAVITAKGSMRQSCVFGEYMMLHRSYTLRSDQNTVVIRDVVENRGQQEEPLMLLYHINFGYPLLDGCARVYTNFDQVAPRDDTAKAAMDQWSQFLPPTPGFDEQVFFHTMSDKTRKDAVAMVHNPQLQLGVRLRFDPTALPYLNHWKCPRAGDYALGLEPGNTFVCGRTAAREQGILPTIQPGEIKEFVVCADILEGNEAADAVAALEK